MAAFPDWVDVGKWHLRNYVNIMMVANGVSTLAAIASNKSPSAFATFIFVMSACVQLSMWVLTELYAKDLGRRPVFYVRFVAGSSLVLLLVAIAVGLSHFNIAFQAFADFHVILFVFAMITYFIVLPQMYHPGEIAKSRIVIPGAPDSPLLSDSPNMLVLTRDDTFAI